MQGSGAPSLRFRIASDTSKVGLNFRLCFRASVVTTFSHNKVEVRRINGLDIVQCCFYEIAAQEIIEDLVGDGIHQAVTWRFKRDATMVRPPMLIECGGFMHEGPVALDIVTR